MRICNFKRLYLYWARSDNSLKLASNLPFRPMGKRIKIKQYLERGFWKNKIKGDRFKIGLWMEMCGWE